MNTPVPTVSADDFELRVLKAPLPVLVDFGAEWCPPCRAIEPVIEDIAEHHAGRVDVVRIDVDAAPSIAGRYRVRALPTVICFVAGQELSRHTGATTKKVLLDLLPR